jgi:[protein-PII] uridylyltransferase
MTDVAARLGVLGDRNLAGAELCAALSDATDEWLAGLFTSAVADRAAGSAGLALVAVGGYGRRELSPQSDIDVLLLTGAGVDPDGVAEAVFYPVWDAKLKLGHAVRTVPEAVSLAQDDLDTATSLLSVRHVAGDTELTAALAFRALRMWQRRAKKWLGELGASVERRHGRAGDTAFLLEPDVKDGRGGLRDVHAIHWAEQARSVMLPGDDAALTRAYGVLLDVRVELHRRTGRPGDTLLLEDQDAVAVALGYADADELMRQVSAAARTIAWRSDEVWERVEASRTRRFGSRHHRPRVLDDGVVAVDQRVQVTPEALADPDGLLVLRVAAAAATSGLRIDRDSLHALSEVAQPLPEPWPAEARRLFAEVFAAGAPAIATVEALDEVGVWELVLPEWPRVRSKPQRNAYHTFTVDRHLCQTAVNAAALVDRVDRPDLLVVGALLHDIGKGFEGDHTEVGIDVVADMAGRMGYPPEETDVLCDMVRYHLLLPDVATRRDLDDDGTLRFVADAVGSSSTLALLGALTEADSQATGPAAWNDWKAGLVRELVRRSDHLLAGGHANEVTDTGFPDPALRARLGSLTHDEVVIERSGDSLVVLAPDQPGLFARVAGVVALSGLDVLAAGAYSEGGRALTTVAVSPPANPERAWAAVERDLPAALAGQLALTARLAERARERAPRQRRMPGVATPAVRIDNAMSEAATVVEVVADDAFALLATVASTLTELGLDIRSAKVQTLGPQVVDTFYVRDAAGAKVTNDRHLAEIQRALGHAIGI